MGRLLLVTASVAALAVASVSQVDAASPSWDTYFVLHRPMSIALPSSWQTLDPLGGDSLNAGNGQTGTYVQVFVFPNIGSQARFFGGLQNQARQTYLQQDPHAVIRSRMVTMPAGRSLEIIAQLTRIVGSRSLPLWIQNYNFVYAGVGYDVEYQGPPSQDSVNLPIFTQSAQSIRFDSVAATPSLASSKTA
jgi:hypothetical protein